MRPIACTDTRRRPAAFSLLELVLAIAILSIALSSIFGALSATKDQYQRLDVLITGRLLAESILAQAQDRIRLGDSRFYDLATDPSVIYTRSADGSWHAPFLSQKDVRQHQTDVQVSVESETPVLGGDGKSNPYFDGTNGPPLPSGQRAENERVFWEGFTYTVGVKFQPVHGQPDGKGPLDIRPDGAGDPDRDLAFVEVCVFHRSRPRAYDPPWICRLTTIVPANEKIPYVGTSTGGD